MSRDRVVDLLTEWLEDQPSRAPESVLRQVLADVEATPQRARWRGALGRALFPRSPALRLVGAVAAVALAAVIGVAIWRGLSGVIVGPQPGCPMPSAPAEARMTEIAVDGYPGYVVFADCSFWVATTTAGTVQRIDALTNEIIATITVGEASALPGGVVMALAVDGDQVWAAARNGFSDRRLVRIDPATNSVVQEIPVQRHPYSMLILDGRAWLGDFEGNVVSVVDLATGELVEEVRLGDGPVQIDDGFGAVWGRSSREMARVDVQTFEVTRYQVPGRAIYVSVGETGVWSASPEGGIFKLSSDGELLVHIESEPEPVRTAVMDGFVYVGSQFYEPDRMEIMRIDEASGEVVDRIPFPYGVTELMSAAAGSLWVPAGGEEDPRIVRVEVPPAP
ncbi:MAG: YncE family protein [Chloroflexota bacterium]|nr:YncE family protein [Chloroflexota bacterium]